MLLFPYLRTKRVAVQLREPSLGDAIAVCKLPAERHELTASAFLRFVARDAEAPQPRYVQDPRLWTVQERALVMCHYLAQVSDDGPDFSLGEAKLTDYIMFDKDMEADSFDAGTIDAKQWVMRPLLGAQAEILERACLNRGDWVVGAIACQILPVDETAPDWKGMSDIQSLEWVKARIDQIRGMAESDFDALLFAYDAGSAALAHFFYLDFDDTGIVFRPNQPQEAGPQNPARFLALSCISPATRRLFE